MSLQKACYIFLLALACVYGGYNFARSLLGPKQGEDFAQYYAAARLLREGLDFRIYDTGNDYQESAKRYGIKSIAEGDESKGVMTYAYPPFVAFLMLPLAYLPYDMARYLFYGLSILMTFGAIPLLFTGRPRLPEDTSISPARREEGRNLKMIFAGGIATALFFPNHYSLYMGQMNSLVFLSCAFCLFFGRQQRALGAGFSLALASLIKLFPLILVPFFIIKRQYRIVAATIFFLCVLSALSFLICTPGLWLVFFRDVLPGQFSGGTWPRNQGVVGFLTRLLTENEYAASLCHDPRLAFGLVLLFDILVGVLLWAHTEKGQGPMSRYEVEYGMYLAAALLILAKSWEHYGMFLLFSYLFLFENLVFRSSLRSKPKAEAILLFLISTSFSVWSFVQTRGTEYSELPRDVFFNIFTSAKFMATLLLFSCTLWSLRTLYCFKGTPSSSQAFSHEF